PRPFLARLRRTASHRASGTAVTATVLGLMAAAPAGAQGVSPAGSEFLVNTYTTGSQFDPRVAMDADGDFVVVWSSPLSNPGRGVYARRYSAAGVPQGDEIVLYTSTSGTMGDPEVAMAANGDFVVAWKHSEGGVDEPFFARRFSAAGVSQGEEFRLGPDSRPTLVRAAMDADGDFVLIWLSPLEFGSPDVFGQRYAASGAPQGEPFRVNTYTISNQNAPEVAMDPDGDFVVTWQSAGQQISYDIYAQRYTAAGVPAGANFLVNTSTTSVERAPDVAMDADGDFVVTWMNPSPAGDYDIHARRYAASGAPVGEEFRVNANTMGSQSTPTVAMDADGGFVATWRGGDNTRIMGRAFTSSGVAVGGDFAVNTTGTAIRENLVAMDADGDAVVIWRGRGVGGDGYDIYGQRYTAVTTGTGEAAPVAGLALDAVPNPTTGSGVVRYALPEASTVRVTLYDVLGREAAVLYDGAQAAGRHEAALDAAALAPGVYLVRLTAGDATLVRRVTVAR
ncbi:MAG TPA: T9SS type A sorting domain-containing protein, partial [Rhodothermales bacterium]|nr:T9SS type A sorting domain-containing protein [Rhodothermales bacterium]